MKITTANKKYITCKFSEKLFQEVSPQNLSIFRIILGVGLLYEAHRIFSLITRYYINPEFYIKWDFFENMPVFNSNTLYLFSIILTITAVLIIFGFLYRIAVFTYLIIYVYFILIEASYYNNHYYFISLLLFISLFTNSDNYCSVKSYLYKKKQGNNMKPLSAPFWNYFLLRFQVFLAYFIAGIVKLNFDWISTNTFRSVMQYGTEYPKESAFYHSELGIYFLTFGGLFFDLIIPLLLLSKKYRIITIPAILIFHTINAATLNIGVFPYLMAGCTLIFFRTDIVDYWKNIYLNLKSKKNKFKYVNNIKQESCQVAVFSKPKYIAIIIYCTLQICIPFRHLLIPGNVGWTGEGNNFAWRMKMGLKAPTRFELFVFNKYTGIEYRPTININPHQYSSLWICPNRIKQIADYVGKKTAKEFKISEDSLKIICKTDLIFNNHPPSPIFDTTVNLLEVKVSKYSHSTFLTENPSDIPKNQYYWLSFLLY